MGLRPKRGTKMGPRGYVRECLALVRHQSSPVHIAFCGESVSARTICRGGLVAAPVPEPALRRSTGGGARADNALLEHHARGLAAKVRL
jgi:hypothetical protein